MRILKKETSRRLKAAILFLLLVDSPLEPFGVHFGGGSLLSCSSFPLAAFEKVNTVYAYVNLSQLSFV